MAVNNTFDFKEVWENQYEISHYLAPVYKSIADESQRGDLYEGKKMHRTAVGDFITNPMGSTGAYSPQNWVETDEFLTIDQAQEVSVTLKEQDLYMTHLPNAVKRAEKTMNRLFNWIDGDVFNIAYQGAGTILDNSYLSGLSSDVGVPVTVSQANVPNIFFGANSILVKNNIDYQPTGKWTGQYKIDKMNYVPVFIMDANTYLYLGLYLGGKVTELGDRVSQSGHVGQFGGFNCFVSNALPWSTLLNLTTNPTDGDTITFMNGVTKNVNGVTGSQAVTFRFKTTPVAAGDLVIASTAALTITNMVAALAAPYTLIANATNTGYFPFVQASETIMQQQFLMSISSTQVTSAQVASASGTYLKVIVQGMGNIPLASSLTATGNGFTLSATHCIAGTSRTISLIMPRMAQITQRPTPAYTVSTDFIAWTYWGRKVFADQSPALIDVMIDSTQFTNMPNMTTN